MCLTSDVLYKVCYKFGGTRRFLTTFVIQRASHLNGDFFNISTGRSHTLAGITHFCQEWQPYRREQRRSVILSIGSKCGVVYRAYVDCADD